MKRLWHGIISLGKLKNVVILFLLLIFELLILQIDTPHVNDLSSFIGIMLLYGIKVIILFLPLIYIIILGHFKMRLISKFNKNFKILGFKSTNGKTPVLKKVKRISNTVEHYCFLSDIELSEWKRNLNLMNFMFKWPIQAVFFEGGHITIAINFNAFKVENKLNNDNVLNKGNNVELGKSKKVDLTKENRLGN